MDQCIWKCSPHMIRTVHKPKQQKNDRNREREEKRVNESTSTNKHSNGDAITNPYATFRRAFKVIYVVLLIWFFTEIRSVWSVCWASIYVYGVHMWFYWCASPKNGVFKNAQIGKYILENICLQFALRICRTMWDDIEPIPYNTQANRRFCGPQQIKHLHVNICNNFAWTTKSIMFWSQ